MKKFRVVFIIIVGLSFAAMGYTQVYSETQSVYLLALELIGLVVLFIGLIVTIISNEGKSKIYKVFIICSYLFLLGFLGRQDITEYKEMTCQDKYGRSFNLARRRLGVPEIPADWHIFGRGNGFVSWVANKTDIGHKVKHIEIDSSCRIEVEDDGYKLKPPRAPWLKPCLYRQKLWRRFHYMGQAFWHLLPGR